MIKSHRMAYALTNGPPENDVLHRCDNRPCCNPAHLWDGTQADNMADMVAKGRQSRNFAGKNGMSFDARKARGEI